MSVPKMPPSSGPGFVDGHLQESCPFTPDEAGVYAALARLVPAQAYSKADFVLKLACVRGYHKEKPRAETTAGELARILEWRDKNRMDEVRAAPTTRRGATPCGGWQGKAPAGTQERPSTSLPCVRWRHARTLLCSLCVATCTAHRLAFLATRLAWCFGRKAVPPPRCQLQSHPAARPAPPQFLQRTLPQEEEFHRYWPTQVHGEDCFGHFVVLEQIAVRLLVPVCEAHRAPLLPHVTEPWTATHVWFPPLRAYLPHLSQPRRTLRRTSWPSAFPGR